MFEKKTKKHKQQKTTQKAARHSLRRRRGEGRGSCHDLYKRLSGKYPKIFNFKYYYSFKSND